eukprot:5560851-Pleurochrysis_carterae.AAC.3
MTLPCSLFFYPSTFGMFSLTSVPGWYMLCVDLTVSEGKVDQFHVNMCPSFVSFFRFTLQAERLIPNGAVFKAPRV